MDGENVFSYKIYNGKPARNLAGQRVWHWDTSGAFLTKSEALAWARQNPALRQVLIACDLYFRPQRGIAI